jgi:hypothetical protein
MLPEMLVLAFSAFVVRMFSRKSRSRRLVVAVCVYMLLYGFWVIGEALNFILKLRREEINQIGGPSYIALLTIIGLGHYCLPLIGYGLACFVQKVRARYSIRIIAEV